MAPSLLMRGRSVMTLGALACLLLAVIVQGRIEGERRGGSLPPLLYLPSGEVLKAVALGFDGLLADVLYLWSVPYFGQYDIKERFYYLEGIFEQGITQLDP